MRKILMVVAAGLLFAAPALADAPAYLPVQGVLAQTDGTPVDGDTDIHFALYTTQTGGTALWSETQTVPVDHGFFTVYLGDSTTLDLATFRDNGTVWLGVTVASDAEMDRFQVASTGFAAFAQYAGDAESLGGVAAADYLTTSSTLSVAWGDLTGIPADIADGDNDTTYTAGTGLNLSGTAFSVDPAVVQSRVTGTCAAGNSIRVIAADGSVTCETDDTGPTYTAGAGISISGGGAISVSGVTGSMITDGTITALDLAANSVGSSNIMDGTVTNVDIATGGVTSANIADGTIGVADVNTAQVQARVSGTCAIGTISAISATGSVTCANTVRNGYTYLGNWTTGSHILDLPGYGDAETTGTSGQVKIVNSSSSSTLMYTVQLCENCAAEEGTLGAGTSFTTAGTAGTYDQIRIVLQYWYGTGTALFMGTRAGTICSGFTAVSL